MSTQVAYPDLSKKEEVALEPIIAHGSRMSWAGILRPGDEFTRPAKSQLCVITAADTDVRLRRYLGKWDNSYKRFTTNFTTSRINVRAVAPGASSREGIQCILHWLDQKDMIRSEFYGDGWPKEVWDSFRTELSNLPKGTLAQKLRSFLNSDLREENEFVSLWRKRVRSTALIRLEEQEELDKYWLPVPATLIFNGTSTDCIFSWSPGTIFYGSLIEALSSPEAQEKKPDLENQAKYYLECVLAKLHGVKFDSPSDFIEDKAYVLRPEVKELLASFTKLEKERISDKEFGRLDRFGFFMGKSSSLM